jgi:hypothetical protein
VDPNAWAVGTQPVSRYLVKSAARRVLLLGLRARDSGFFMVHGHKPRLWPGPDGSGGLTALEHRWQALWSHQCARLRVQARSGRRRVEAATPAVPVAAGAVATGRVHPLERAAAAAQQRGQRSEAFADSYDALLIGVEAEVAAPQPSWRLAYQALRLRRLDRVTRHFGWRMLHVALRCGAATVLWCRPAGAAGCGVLLGCAVCG